MKHKVALKVYLFTLAWSFVALASPVSGQNTAAYRVTGLVVNTPGATHQSPNLLNPWGIAFLPGGNFFVAENASGLVDSYDAVGNPSGGTQIPAPPSSPDPFSRPTGIVAIPEADFGPLGGASFQFLVAADNGTIWGFSTTTGLPQTASKFVDSSSSAARYTGLAVLRPSCCGAFLAVANFGQGTVDTFTRVGDPLSLSPLVANPFVDPNLPAGYAPFNIQKVGDLAVVTYAKKDGAGNPIAAQGLGIVNFFDQTGNFVTRFISEGGEAFAPWGVARASASFGPFSDDILIANAGADGTINAFDPATGNFLGQLTDGTGNPLLFVGMHGLAFRDDGVGDANTLYNLDAGASGAAPVGTFSTITVGGASFLGLTFSDNNMTAFVLPGDAVTISATLGAQSGTPTGTVTFVDSCCAVTSTATQTTLGSANVVNGAASLVTSFPGGGDHQITATYSGDADFVPGKRSSLLAVLLESATTVTAPANASAGTPIVLTANIASTAGVQLASITGQVTFSEGNTILGTVDVTSGAAQFTVDSLTPGRHSIVALFTGNRFFQGSHSAPATIDVANADFSVGANPSSATVTAGKSTQFMLTVTPGSGFTNTVTFSCSPVAGITCTFSPPTVTPQNGAANTTLTVNTAASVTHYGLLPFDMIAPGLTLLMLALCGLAVLRRGRLKNVRAALITATAVLVIVGVSLALGGCGGYSNNMTANRGTASITVTAQSGSVSHTTTVMVTVQ